MTDVRNIQLKSWKRLGCDGAYLQLRGLEGITGVYVGKLGAGASTQPERHLYEKVIFILQGEGVAEIQQRDRVPQNIQWRADSLFSPPMNTLHRLMNYSNEPALFLAITTAPMALDHYHNEQFVFNSDFSFNDRYDAEAELFRAAPRTLISRPTTGNGFGKPTLFPTFAKPRSTPKSRKARGQSHSIRNFQ